MGEFTTTLTEATLKRLQEIAAEKSCSIHDVVRHFLDCAIKIYDTAKTPEEIEEQTQRLTPSRHRPVIDRKANQAMVDKFKPKPPEGLGD